MKKLLLIILLAASSALLGQYNGKDFGVSASWSYLTTSKIFYFPNAADPYLRNQSVDLDDVNSIALGLKYRLSEDFLIGLNIEYYDHTSYAKTVIASSSTGVRRFEAADGYSIVPVEFTAYYLMPFSNESFKITMGAGVAYYFANYKRVLGGVELESQLNNTPVGIHVNVGVEYIYNEYFGIFADMKFRDPEFELQSEYTNNEFTFRDKVYRINESRFDTRVNLDGVVFTLGINYLFNLPF